MFSRTTRARDTRRRLLKGAVIVFIGAGYSAKRFIFERAKELGVRCSCDYSFMGG